MAESVVVFERSIQTLMDLVNVTDPTVDPDFSLSLTHISKSFYRKSEVRRFRVKKELRPVLKDVNLKISGGNTVCVVGKNGSGKTTLLRILSTLIRPDAGEGTICGFDLVDQYSQVRKRVGVMLNAGEGGFYPRLSGSSNLEFYAALYRLPPREARRRVALLLSDLGLQDRIFDQYQSYSTGMRRRLALARALLPDAPVLLLDEPTLGIDPWSKGEVHKYLKHLSEQGKIIVCTTNSVEEARTLAREICLLDHGALNPVSVEELPAS